MSKTKNRDTALDDRLARLLDTPLLTRVVPLLPPETLHQLIRHRGLDACTDLVTSATPAQLSSLLDLDLWQTRPGRDEQFDVDRFGHWVEVLIEAGTSTAARTVSVLDRNLVIAGLSRYVRVFDPGIFEPVEASDDEPADRHESMRTGDSIGAGDSFDDETAESDSASGDEFGGEGLECEVGGYLVRARRSEAWDAIIALLVALDSEHESCFRAVMQGCCRLSDSRPEIDGLDDLLAAPEQHLHDVSTARERRRAQQGYATAGDARAFLQMARQPKQPPTAADGRAHAANPIVAAYLRAIDDDTDDSEAFDSGLPADERQLRPASPQAESGPPSGPADQSKASTGGSDVGESLNESVAAVFDLLSEAGLMPGRPRALLAGAEQDPASERLTLVRRLMTDLSDRDEAAYFERTRELAFLANTLLAGCSVQSRAFTPQEASDAAASVCNLGLEHWLAKWPTTPESLLIDHDLVTAFEIGWSVLHQEVSLSVAQQLASILDGLRLRDPETLRGVSSLRRALVKHHDAGTPWLARDAADVLAELDLTAWISVLGLLGECPVVPSALTAIVEGSRTAVNPTAFAFISTAAQIGDIRTFMRKLPDLLSR